MTPIKPEDRPKVIALLAAVAVVFGYGLLQAAKIFAPGSGGGATTPVADTGTAVPGGAAPVGTVPASVASAPAGASGAGNKTTAPATGAAPSSAAPAPGTVLVTIDREKVRPNLTKNPFKPLPPPAPAVGTAPVGTGGAAPVPSQSGVVTVVPVPTPSRSPVALTPPPVTPAPLLPRTGIEQGGRQPVPGRFVPPAPNGPRVLPAPVVPAEPLQLVGVVWGARPVAMIRVGGREFFVRQGERVADYRVIGLGMENVTLRSDKQARFMLRVGDPPLGGAPSVVIDAPDAVSFAAPLPPPTIAHPTTAAPVPPVAPAATQTAAAPSPATTPGLPASAPVLGSSEAAALDPAPSTAPDPAPETPDPATPPEPRPAAPLDTFATMPPAMPRTGEPEDGGTDG